MQIILLHPRKSEARTINVSGRHVVAALLLMLGAVCAISAGLNWWLIQRGLKLPGGIALAAMPASSASTLSNDQYLRENLNLMAARIGEMQAQMVRLDALGARVSGLAGVPPQEFDFRKAPARGGPAPSLLTRQMTLPELQAELDRVSRGAELRSDYLSVIESTLMDQQTRAKLMPTVRPVAAGYDSSGFGYRFDPFSGRRTHHDGVDFVAGTGTPIVAAAGGVVVASEWHPEYGNMVDIDHGNGLKTRYAHSSKVFVKTGDLVKAGQKIAEIGSTGRSTGAHLHFEVHVNGAAQNPNAFLQAARMPGNVPVPPVATLGPGNHKQAP
jgi:murein DD-endopeptidase MepM/ murein hydrolase activator NlpD